MHVKELSASVIMITVLVCLNAAMLHAISSCYSLLHIHHEQIFFQCCVFLQMHETHKYMCLYHKVTM